MLISSKTKGMGDFRIGRHLHNSLDDHVLNAAEFLVVYKRHSGIFVLIIKGQFLPVDFVPLFVEFLDSRLSGKMFNDLIDGCLDLLRQISVNFLSLNITDNLGGGEHEKIL